VLSFLSFLLALYWFGKSASPIVGSESQ
jgi:hypothetical protein